MTINEKIDLTDGTGFFMAVTKGNIIVDPAVSSLEVFEYAPDLIFTYPSKLGVREYEVKGSCAVKMI